LTGAIGTSTASGRCTDGTLTRRRSPGEIGQLIPRCWVLPSLRATRRMLPGVTGSPMRWTRRTNSPNLPRLPMRLSTHGESLVQPAGDAEEAAEGATRPTMGGHSEQTGVQAPVLGLSSDNRRSTPFRSPPSFGLTVPVWYGIRSLTILLTCMVSAISQRRRDHGNETQVPSSRRKRTTRLGGRYFRARIPPRLST
jgi:hypothetical protein